ncbi:MAG: S9 family peptidase [Zestosphaera sp.]
MSRLLGYEDLSKLVLVSSPSIHPSSKLVAFLTAKINLEKNMYESAVWMAGVDGCEVYPFTGGPDDFCPQWCPDGRKLSFVSRRGLAEGEKGASIYIASLESREPWRLAYFKGGVTEYGWSPDSRKVAVISKVGEAHEDVKIIDRIPIWGNGEGFTYNVRKHVFVVEASSGITHQLTDGDLNVNTMAWSPDGRKVAYAASVEELKPYETRLFVHDIESGERVELPMRGYAVSALTWSPDGERIAFIGRDVERGRGLASHNKVYVYDLDSEELKVLTEGLDRNALNTLGSDARWKSCSPSLKWIPDGGRSGHLYFLVSDAGKVALYRVAPEEGLRKHLELDGKSVDSFDVGLDGAVAFTAMGPDEPAELYISKAGDLVKLTSFNESFVKTFNLTKPQHFTFKASDGVEIDGWILWPPEEGVGGGKMPWVLYIHGGPKTMYGDGFFFEFHLLAHKGFAVVYTNPRGSDGYSEEFADIRCHFGERDYQDLMEAVDYVLTKYGGRLDPERVGVAGGSYGGFMVNWIVTHTGRFAAAVTQRSISDWVSKFGTTDIGFYFNADMIGCGQPPWRNLQAYLEKSPITHVENARTPTLIIHSMEDYRCWLDQAIELFTALKLRGVETRLLLFPNENHELTRSGKPKHRVENLKHITRWFLKHLKGVEERD